MGPLSNYARPLLTVTELERALSVRDGAMNLDEDNITSEDALLSACVGLVIIGHESNVIRLVHCTP